jgi:Uma2 family endonuclease
MTPKSDPRQAISIEDYLAGEERTQTKHEYLAGDIVAMGGASRRHGLIVTALSFAITGQARARGCQLFIADMRVRIDQDGETYFYYPDLVLTCDPDDRHNLYCSRPCLIVEVLSDRTERIDRREKRLAYSLLPSLREYVLIDQERVCVETYRRGEPGWTHETLTDGALHLECLGLDVPVAEIYADIDWVE